MALFVAKTLLESAQGGAQTKRYRDFVVAYFEGEGALGVPNAIWQPAAAWAGGRQPSGNRMRDRGSLMQRLDVLVTRRGTTATSTTGGMIPLARLRNAMKSEGLDIKEWNFPPDDVLDRALDPSAGAEEAPAEQQGDKGPGTFVRLDPRRVRSSKGFELYCIDDYTVEYRAGEQFFVFRGVPGTIDGTHTFRMRPAALSSLPGDDRNLLLANFVAGMAFQGISVRY